MPLVLWALGLLVASGYSIAGTPEQGAGAARVLSVIGSLHVAVLVFAASFGIAFRNEFRSFLERMTAVDLPGGTSMKAPLQTEPPPGSGAPSTPVELTAPDEDTQLSLMTEQDIEAENLRQWLAQATRARNYWYLQYLHEFMKPVTQNVLRWFEMIDEPMSVARFHEIWAPHIKDPNERWIILNALSQFQLVDQHGQMLSLSDAGRAFLSFLDGQWKPLEQDAPPQRVRPQIPPPPEKLGAKKN